MIKTLGRLALGAGLLTTSLLTFAAPPVVIYDGETYQGEDLPGALRQSFYQLELQQAEQQRQAVNQYILNRYLQEEAERQDISIRELQQKLLAAPEPSEAEIRAFYDANRERIPGSFEQVRENIANYLKNQRVSSRQQALLDQIREEKGFRMEITEPEPPRFEIALEGYPSIGPDDAPVTIVEYADYQCPHCKHAGPVVKDIVERYGDQVRLVFKDFPINPSGKSREVAEAAACADLQEQFWPFHDLAFERQQFLGSITPDMLATELGLDMAAFNRCLSDKEGAPRVATSAAEARRLGVTGTPAFFINGQPLPDSQAGLEASLIEAIEAELDEAS